MRSLGSICAQMASTKTSKSRYRREARFLVDPLASATKLDRNQRAKLLAQAEGIERRTKAKGCRSGILGLTGLAVLRALIMHFQSRSNGLCFPSYAALMKVTGFCKQTVAKALRALESVGLVRIFRRLVRRLVERDGVTFATTVQASNFYTFHPGAMVCIRYLVPIRPARSWPAREALMKLLFQPGLRGRENQHTPTSISKL